MELDCATVAILTPVELKNLRQLAGWTLHTLSRESGVSLPQLSQFENAKNGLRPDQVAVCRKLLLNAASQRAARISALLMRERVADMVEAEPEGQADAGDAA